LFLRQIKIIMTRTGPVTRGQPAPPAIVSD
jgi:hypothetical protein